MRIRTNLMPENGGDLSIDSLHLTFGKRLADGYNYSTAIDSESEQKVAREFIEMKASKVPAGRKLPYELIENDSLMPTGITAKDPFAMLVGMYEGLGSFDKQRFLSHYRLGSRAEADAERDAAVAEKNNTLLKVGEAVVREAESKQALLQLQEKLDAAEARIAVLERERDDALRAAAGAASPEAPAKAKASKAPKAVDAPEAPESK